MIMKEMILVLLLKLSDGSLALVVGDAAGSAEWLVSQPQTMHSAIADSCVQSTGYLCPNAERFQATSILYTAKAPPAGYG